MNVDTTRQTEPDVITPEGAMLDEVYRGLVRIHNAIAIRTSDDKIVIPWTERALMDVIEKVGAFRREQRRSAAERADSAVS